MADWPHRALSEADRRHELTIPPDLQHGKRTSPLGGPDDACGRGAQHRFIDLGRRLSIISSTRPNRSRGIATSAI
jgi:hypothetical protein